MEPVTPSLCAQQPATGLHPRSDKCGLTPPSSLCKIQLVYVSSLRLEIPSHLHPHVFPPNPPARISLVPTRVACLCYLIPPYFTSLIIFSKKYTPWSCPLCQFLPSPLTPPRRKHRQLCIWLRLLLPKSNYLHLLPPSRNPQTFLKGRQRF